MKHGSWSDWCPWVSISLVVKYSSGCIIFSSTGQHYPRDSCYSPVSSHHPRDTSLPPTHTSSETFHESPPSIFHSDKWSVCSFRPFRRTRREFSALGRWEWSLVFTRLFRFLLGFQSTTFTSFLSSLPNVPPLDEVTRGTLRQRRNTITYKFLFGDYLSRLT